MSDSDISKTTLAHYATLFTKKTTTLQNGATVFYREANTGADKTIFVVHGITGTHYSMLQMAGPWAERGYHVVMIDLPGHGKSDRIRVSHFKDLADWLDDVIQQLVPGRPLTLVGNSFGSAVCFSYISHYELPDGSRVILGAPTPTLSRLTARLEQLSKIFPEKVLYYGFYRNPLIEAIRMRFLIANVTDDLMRSRFYESLRSEAKLVQHKYAMDLTGLMARDKPYHQPLKNEAIHENIVVVYGDDDKIAGSDVGERMTELLPRAKIMAAQQSGHLIHIEATDSLDKALTI